MLTLPQLMIAGLAPSSRSAWGFDAAALAQARYLTQRVDHFAKGDETNKATWQQAYFINEEHFAPGGPAFLYVGGEGPLSAWSVTSNFIVDWLPKVKGVLFALEHRYYGCHNVSSCPYTRGASTSPAEQMRYLTTEQALADLAAFHDYARTAYRLPAATKFVAIGGSYPGMLAAFVRATYPTRFAASVASSAPVHGVLDYTGFQDAIARGYEMSVEGVRGSPECAKAIADGHATVGELLATARGRERLAALFPSAVPTAEWLESDTNQRTFAGCGVASFPAQANRPDCTSAGCGVSQICELMTAADGAATQGMSPLERLAALAEAQAAAGARDMTRSCEMDWEMPGDLPPVSKRPLERPMSYIMHPTSYILHLTQ